jgi:hypothetical protein
MLPCATCTYSSHCLKWATQYCPDYKPNGTGPALAVITGSARPSEFSQSANARPTMRHKSNDIRLATVS